MEVKKINADDELERNHYLSFFFVSFVWKLDVFNHCVHCPYQLMDLKWFDNLIETWYVLLQWINPSFADYNLTSEKHKMLIHEPGVNDGRVQRVQSARKLRLNELLMSCRLFPRSSNWVLVEHAKEGFANLEGVSTRDVFWWKDKNKQDLFVQSLCPWDK